MHKKEVESLTHQPVGRTGHISLVEGEKTIEQFTL